LNQLRRIRHSRRLALTTGEHNAKFSAALARRGGSFCLQTGIVGPHIAC
jgi:hypothetical protein